MKSINTYIVEKFKISKDIEEEKFYIFVPIGELCTYCREKYPNNLFNGNLVSAGDFHWSTVFVLSWDEIMDIFIHFKHKMPEYFSLNRFLIYDIQNIKSYSSIDDFLDKVHNKKVSGRSFKYNEKYTIELDETIK